MKGFEMMKMFSLISDESGSKGFSGTGTVSPPMRTYNLETKK
jgi:hypothetical protein